MKTLKRLSIAMICVALQACEGNIVAMDVLYRSNQCNNNLSGLVSLKNIEAFEQITTRDALSTSAPRSLTPSSLTPSSLTPSSLAPVDLNFADKNIVLVALGEKPTAGYRLEVENKPPQLKGNILHLPIQYRKPVGDVQAQVITRPCVIISLDKGAYQIVRVNDYSLLL